MNKFSDQKIVDSWMKNSRPWVSAIRNNEIESRLLVTNKAIIDSVVKHKPQTALDVGCGEGWLVRELVKVGISVKGVDIVPDLVNAAKKAGGGSFECLSYEELSSSEFDDSFDMVICNFSLLGCESVEGLFKAMPTLLNDNGVFIMQTIHPMFSGSDLPYEDGWREGSWLGFNTDFSDPAPWYFRTLDTWKKLFADNGLVLTDLLEPLHPTSNQPASLIFMSKTAM